SATVAAVGGGVGFLHSTADGGRTWVTTELPERGFALTDLDFPGRGTGVVVDGQPDASGGSAVYRTTDGGKTWGELRFG
ncbi:WD40/YVTN/BNR-like repeat-containing protein, partial [Amycolatopsis mediterranei]